MRLTEKCLISCLVVLSGIIINRDQMDVTGTTTMDVSMIGVYDEFDVYWRHYTQGYYVNTNCERNLIINGQKVGNPIYLTNKTTLGTYYCPRDDYPFNISIGYILCDPSKIAPEMVCPIGHFCVINGSSTNCQKHLDCELLNFPEECTNGSPLHNGKCSKYNNATDVPGGCYSVAGNHMGCLGEPCLTHKGNVVEYLSTILVSNSSDLQLDVWNLTNDNVECSIRISKKEQYPINFTASSFPAIRHERLPAKVNVFCGDLFLSATTQFYILFYEKNRAQFSIVQNGRNITVNITNATNKEVWLDPSAPFNCTVSIGGGLFIKAFSTETDKFVKPNIGNDSIQIEYKDNPKAIYTCTAKVYYYEQFPPNRRRFKLLYNESRQWRVLARPTETTTGTQSYASSMTEESIPAGGNTVTATKESISGTPWKLIAICMGSILGTTFLVIIVVLAIRAYRKDRMQLRAKEENRPQPFRSVRAPKTDRFKSMTVDRSASIVSASGLQPSHGSSLIRLLYKEKPRARERTGSHDTASSHRRRSSQGIETRMPSASRRGTGPTEPKIRVTERAGSHGPASNHRRRSSQGTGARGSGAGQKRAGSVDPKTRSSSLI